MSIMEMEEIKSAIAGVDAKVEYNGGGHRNPSKQRPAQCWERG